MTDEYVPDTQIVREDYVRFQLIEVGISNMTREQAIREFNAWLESVRAEERERIARNIETADPLYFDEHGAPCIDPGVAARIVREGA